MKKLFILLTVISLVVLCACSSGEISNGEESEVVTEEEETAYHTPATIKASPDKYTAYINDYVGRNCASFGYYSIGGDRNDYVGNGYIELIFVTEDGSYIDISNDEELKEYVVVAQSLEPNTEVKYVYDVDSEGKEYDNLIIWQSVEEIVLQVKPVGEKSSFVSDLTPIAVSPDKHTAYVKDYLGRNLCSCGYVSLGGDFRDSYGAGTVKLVLVSSDGTYIDFKDEEVIKQYVVVKQSVEPNTEIKYGFQTDSTGEETYTVSSQTCQQIDLYVDKVGNRKPDTSGNTEIPVEATTKNEKPKENQSSAGDLEIKESGYVISNGYLYYGVILHNNGTSAIQFPTFRVTAKDKNGAILGTTDEIGAILYPNQDYARAYLAFSVDEEPENVIFEAVEPDDYNILDTSELVHKEYKSLNVSNAIQREDKITGEVSNPNSYDIDQVLVSVIFRDDKGEIAGGDLVFVDHLKANGTMPFQLSIFGMEFATDSFEVYATSWDF